MTIDIVDELFSRQKMAVLCLSAALVLGGCAIQKKDEPHQVWQSEQQPEKQNRQLARLVGEIDSLNQELDQRDSEVAKLQLKLLEKQAEINQHVLSQQYAIQEVVRTKAKLRSHSSKAEAVANMAEVKMVLKAVAAGPTNEQQRRVVRQAERMLAMSNEALEEGNIDGASYLSNRAHQLVQPIRERQRDQKRSEKSGAEVVFASPLIMTVLKRCNVRMAPDIKEAVLFRLDSGASVKALAYVENWVRIEDESKDRGWVYYQLLGTVQ